MNDRPQVSRRRVAVTAAVCAVGVAGMVGASFAAVPLYALICQVTGIAGTTQRAVIGYEPLVDDPDVFPVFLQVPEPTGAHVVLLGPEAVLMATSAPETAKLLEDRGLAVVTVDISEFERLEGCVTCLSVRLRRRSAETDYVWNGSPG